MKLIFYQPCSLRQIMLNTLKIHLLGMVIPHIDFTKICLEYCTLFVKIKFPSDYLIEHTKVSKLSYIHGYVSYRHKLCLKCCRYSSVQQDIGYL